MKKVFSAAIILAMVVAMVMGISVQTTAFAANVQLKIYNWAEYMDLEIIDEFEEYYFEQTGDNLEIVYSTFDTNETMLTNITKGGANVDLICPSEYAIERLVRTGALEELDMAKIPNYANIDTRITDKVDDVFGNLTVGGAQKSLNSYFVPYMWGTLGILYNSEVVTQADLDAGWGLLWNKGGNTKLNKTILFKDSIRDAYVAAVLYLKENDRLPEKYKTLSVQQLINTIDGTLLKAVEEVLREQKKFLKDYEVDFGKGEMLAGKAYADLAWSGDALYAMELNDNLNYFVPEIGSNIWFDGWAIPKNAQNKDIAYMFINYLCQPEESMRNAMEIGYTSALSIEALSSDAGAIAILTENGYTAEEFFGDELRYPVINDKLGVMKDFGAMNDEVVAMWERVKAEGGKTWILIVVIVAIVVVAGGVVAFFFLKNKRGRKMIKRPYTAPQPKAAYDSENTETADEEETENNDN